MAADLTNRRSLFPCLTLSFVTLLMSASCGDQVQQGESVAGGEVLNVTLADPVFQGRKYELITPTGVKLMKATFEWEREQKLTENARRYAQPAQCATNVSKVFAKAGLGRYSSPLVPELVNQIRRNGGLVRTLPKSKAGILKVINDEFNGQLPVGTLISGCLYADCSGNAGDGHVAMVGDVDDQGALLAYHNNWYRPDNEGGQWKPHMIPMDWYNKGYRRMWMSTPWMNIFRSPPRVGSAVDFQVILPAIDDLDPTNYHVTLSIPQEILSEVRSGQGWALDRDGNQVKR
jgi:hypothetical protein